MPNASEKKLELSSSFQEMNRLEPFIEELKTWADFSDENYGRIMLTLSEAVNNAIVHGNNENPDKKVRIICRVEGQNLIISVEDEGEGFDPNTIPDPLAEENLLKEGGRGVFLIQQYADEMSFTKGGRKLTMTFDIS